MQTAALPVSSNPVPQTILIVDDEPNIRDLAKLYLEKEGFVVVSAENGAIALDRVAEHDPDLMVLDLMMPEMDGYEVCRRVRVNSSLPIIMLTARDDDIDQIIGLELGADDYMTKPFNPRVLVAQVKAVLRRVAVTNQPSDDEVRELGNVRIEPLARAVQVAGNKVELRAKEFDLLLALADHTNRVLSRDQLLDLVWGYEFYGQTRTVDVHVAHLRDKLDGATIAIETVWGKGYKLTTD